MASVFFQVLGFRCPQSHRLPWLVGHNRQWSRDGMGMAYGVSGDLSVVAVDSLVPGRYYGRHWSCDFANMST